ncbi:MAG: GatB/YqeY domain-containing protein [Candidatus Dormibacteraceae bacterium]
MPDPVRVRQRLMESLKAALNARDSIAVAALRSAMSAIDNAGAVDPSNAPAPTGGIVGNVRLGAGAAEVARRELSTQDAIEVVRAEVRDRAAAAAEYERLGRAEQASRLNAEAAALASFLETALTDP